MDALVPGGKIVDFVLGHRNRGQFRENILPGATPSNIY